MNLRDLMTGMVPGNALNQIGLGDAPDPQFNRFTYNIWGNLGPGAGVQTGMPNIAQGFTNAQPQQQQAPISPQMGYQRVGGTPPVMGPISGSFLSNQGNPQMPSASYLNNIGNPYNNQTLAPGGDRRMGDLMGNMMGWKRG